MTNSTLERGKGEKDKHDRGSGQLAGIISACWHLFGRERGEWTAPAGGAAPTAGLVSAPSSLLAPGTGPVSDQF